MTTKIPLTLDWAYQLLLHVDRYFQGGYLTVDGLTRLKADVHDAVADSRKIDAQAAREGQP